MMFVLSAHAYRACSDLSARPLFVCVPAIRAKLIISFKIIGLLANHNFRFIDHYHFTMRRLWASLGGPRRDLQARQMRVELRRLPGESRRRRWW